MGTEWQRREGSSGLLAHDGGLGIETAQCTVCNLETLEERLLEVFVTKK